MTSALRFADQESISLVKEFERLVDLLGTYACLILRKRRTTYKKSPVKPVKCALCTTTISGGELYYAAGKRSAHDECVDKAMKRRDELAPIMGHSLRRKR